MEDFYHIIAQDGLHFEVQTHAAHPIYQGHFPEQPITPGACLLQMTQELLSKATGKPMHLTRVTNLKFVAVHTPDKPLAVEFNDLGNHKYQIAIYDSTTVYAKMSAEYMCPDSNV